MGMIEKAVNEGVRQGFERSAYKHCLGKDDPEERCPVNPSEGCICYYMAWHEQPWYRRIFRKPPPRPSEDQALRVISSAMFDGRF